MIICDIDYVRTNLLIGSVVLGALLLAWCIKRGKEIDAEERAKREESKRLAEDNIDRNDASTMDKEFRENDAASGNTEIKETVQKYNDEPLSSDQIIRTAEGHPRFDGVHVCTQCGTIINSPTSLDEGFGCGMAILLVLGLSLLGLINPWLLAIPAIITIVLLVYKSLTWFGVKKYVCPVCHSVGRIIPTGSPEGRYLVGKYTKENIAIPMVSGENARLIEKSWNLLEGRAC